MNLSDDSLSSDDDFRIVAPSNGSFSFSREGTGKSWHVADIEDTDTMQLQLAARRLKSSIRGLSDQIDGFDTSIMREMNRCDSIIEQFKLAAGGTVPTLRYTCLKVLAEHPSSLASRVESASSISDSVFSKMMSEIVSKNPGVTSESQPKSEEGTVGSLSELTVNEILANFRLTMLIPSKRQKRLIEKRLDDRSLGYSSSPSVVDLYDDDPFSAIVKPTVRSLTEIALLAVSKCLANHVLTYTQVEKKKLPRSLRHRLDYCVKCQRKSRPTLNVAAAGKVGSFPLSSVFKGVLDRAEPKRVYSPRTVRPSSAQELRRPKSSSNAQVVLGSPSSEKKEKKKKKFKEQGQGKTMHSDSPSHRLSRRSSLRDESGVVHDQAAVPPPAPADYDDHAESQSSKYRVSPRKKMLFKQAATQALVKVEATISSSKEKEQEAVKSPRKLDIWHPPASHSGECTPRQVKIPLLALSAPNGSPRSGLVVKIPAHPTYVSPVGSPRKGGMTPRPPSARSGISSLWRGSVGSSSARSLRSQAGSSGFSPEVHDFVRMATLYVLRENFAKLGDDTVVALSARKCYRSMGSMSQVLQNLIRNRTWEWQGKLPVGGSFEKYVARPILEQLPEIAINFEYAAFDDCIVDLGTLRPIGYNSILCKGESIFREFCCKFPTRLPDDTFASPNFDAWLHELGLGEAERIETMILLGSLFTGVYKVERDSRTNRMKEVVPKLFLLYDQPFWKDSFIRQLIFALVPPEYIATPKHMVVPGSGAKDPYHRFLPNLEGKLLVLVDNFQQHIIHDEFFMDQLMDCDLPLLMTGPQVPRIWESNGDFAYQTALIDLGKRRVREATHAAVLSEVPAIFCNLVHKNRTSHGYLALPPITLYYYHFDPSNPRHLIATVHEDRIEEMVSSKNRNNKMEQFFSMFLIGARNDLTHLPPTTSGV